MVAAPEGDLAARCRERGLAVLAVPELRGSFKLHPVETPRALLDGLRGVAALRGAARRAGADLVHANSVRAGLIALGARLLGGPPVVVHVRDVLPPSPLARALRAVVSAGARRVIAISEHTGAAFGGGRTVVVHNPVDLERYARDRADPRAFRHELGLGEDDPLLVVVGQITKWKGQDDAIRALEVVRARHPRAQLAIVGEPKFVARATRYDNRSFEAELRALAERVGGVHLTGERDDVPEVMAAADVVLVPSWEEPFGRTVVEAMALGRCVVATAVGGPREIVSDGVDGVLLAPRDPRAWGATVSGLLADPGRRRALGDAAERRARAFGRREHARRVRAIYAGG